MKSNQIFQKEKHCHFLMQLQSIGKWIEASSNVDLIMVAPKGPGSKVRETYLDNFGTPSIVAVEQDFTGKAWDRTLGIAKSNW